MYQHWYNTIIKVPTLAKKKLFSQVVYMKVFKLCKWFTDIKLLKNAVIIAVSRSIRISPKLC